LDEILIAKLLVLPGVKTSRDELSSLTSAIPWTPIWLLDLMEKYPLASCSFSIEDTDDMSGLGVEMQWLSADGIIDEATNAYPGIAAARHQYIPIGVCLVGTGDPYFIRAEAQPSMVYRIPHSAVREDELNIDGIECVAPSLLEFLEVALRTR
jgi:hypothetical protein